MDKLTALGGYKNRASANTAYCIVRKKLKAAVENAESDQANGTTGMTTPAIGRSTSTQARKANQSTTKKRAANESKIKNEPQDDLLDFSDVGSSTEPKVKTEDENVSQQSSKKRKPTSNSAKGGSRKAGGQSASNSSAATSAQQTPINQGNRERRSPDGRDTGLEPERMEIHKRARIEHDLFNDRQAYALNKRHDSPNNALEPPSPGNPSPNARLTLGDLLKNYDFPETEQELFDREQASIDDYGMTDEETDLPAKTQLTTGMVTSDGNPTQAGRAVRNDPSHDAEMLSF
jgi:hypothetical protein